MKKGLLVWCLLTMAAVMTMNAQSTSISPSRLYFKTAPGETKKQTVHVTNNSSEKESFTISFGDFASPGIDGKTQMMEAGQNEHSCSKYLSASPSFFELEPGKSIDIEVNVDLPNLPEANKVKWGTLMLKLTKERTQGNNSDGGVGMGLVETFQFVVHIFQTPPSVTLKKAEITSFQELTDSVRANRTLGLITKNTGDAILDCATYIEFSSLSTGVETKVKPSAFTLLPESSRLIKFAVPADLPKGKYTVTAVIDFGSRDDVQAAQMELEIK